jgi:hypothetical protein
MLDAERSSKQPLVAPAVARPDEIHWGLDPLFSAHVKVLACHLAALPDASPLGDAAWLSNHPIRYVDVLGVIISLDPRHPTPNDSRVSFTLDDGTGLIECVHWWNGMEHAARRRMLMLHRLGALLHVHGRLGRFRQARQITVERVWAEDDLLAECLHWARASHLWSTCYSRHFTPTLHEADERGAIGDGGRAKKQRVWSPPVALVEAVRDALRSTARVGGSSGTSAIELAREVGGDWPGARRTAELEYVREALRQLEESSDVYVVGTGAGGQPLYRAVL